MFESHTLTNEALFDLVTAGKASLDQIEELKGRIENDPLLAWFYKESLYERQFTEELSVAAHMRIEQIREELIERARENAPKETHLRLETARELNLGL